MNARGKIRAAAVIALIFLAGLAGAQQPDAASQKIAASLKLDQAIPTHPSILTETLPNGLRYYVRGNARPNKRAELRLVVKAGSVLEDDDQQGLAHFVEHMAFNGTMHFPGEEVVRFLQSIGMRFGADVNAGTSFDETTYMLTVPTDDPAVLDRSFQILEDWAHNVTFDSEEIEKERGVVLEEWRLRRSAGSRLQEKEFPILLKGSRYADRLPIGKPEIIQTFKPETLKRFYRDWYRPDLMAVVAVGDFNVSAVEAMIKAHFGPIPAPKPARKRPVYDVPNHSGTLYIVTADKELTGTSVELDNLMAARKEGSTGNYRAQIVDTLFTSMLSDRFAQIAQAPDAPIIQAGVDRAAFIARTKNTATLFAEVKNNQIEESLGVLVTEAERVRKFGFTQSELDRAKQGIQRSYERMLTQRDDRSSASHAAEYIRNYLTNESLPGADLEFALHQRFLPEIQLKEVNAVAKDWFGSANNRFVTVRVPDKPDQKTPTAGRLAEAIKTASAAPITAYVDTAANLTLMDSKPKAGTIVKTTEREPGITEWELSNGARVVLKPTRLKNDEIMFRAMSWGGTSLASDADYIPASTAAGLVSAGGLGKLNAIDLNRALTGKVATASPFINELQQGLTGGSSPKDLETMFQLINLTFTAPRGDAAAFQTQVAQAKSALANQTASPNFALSKTLTDTLYQGHLRRQVTTTETVDKWNLEKSLAFYKERFADAGSFTFFFVGDFDLATIRPLVETYLAGLPATGRHETWKDVGVRAPKGVIEKSLEKGIEPRSQVVIVFTGPFQFDQTHRIAIESMADALDDRLRESIREELGGTYSVSAGASYSRLPIEEYRFTIQFACDPARVDELTKRVYAEIEKLKTDGITEREISSERETLLRSFETDSRQNSYLLNQIANRYRDGQDPAGYLAYPDDYRKLDAAAIQQAAKTYLDMKNRIQVTLYPEKK
ncbi:MAG TPA: insulinase family protein [Terriglobia bacterium]|nr:insulinase family protein [Terriglobia bacterium]